MYLPFGIPLSKTGYKLQSTDEFGLLGLKSSIFIIINNKILKTSGHNIYSNSYYIFKFNNLKKKNCHSHFYKN